MDGCKARAFDCWVSFVGGHVVGLTEGGGGECCPAGETLDAVAFRGSNPTLPMRQLHLVGLVARTSVG